MECDEPLKHAAALCHVLQAGCDESLKHAGEKMGVPVAPTLGEDGGLGLGGSSTDILVCRLLCCFCYDYYFFWCYSLYQTMRFVGLDHAKNHLGNTNRKLFRSKVAFTTRVNADIPNIPKESRCRFLIINI